MVGGTIRDVVLGPRIVGSHAYYPRDIDILLIGVSHADVKRRFGKLCVRETRFGGAHLVDKKPGGLEVLFDVWTLEDTWAFKTKATLAPVAIQFFPQTPFLNLDTAVIELQTQRGKARRFYENDFIDGINQRRIEINLEENPYPAICMVRALIMAAKLQFGIGPKLLDFALRQASKTSIEQLMEAQRSHYGFYRCSAKELISWVASLRHAAQHGLSYPKISVETGRQLTLWKDYPPSAAAESECEPSESDLVPA